MDLDESRLDDAEALAAGDPSGVLRALASAGGQVRQGVWLAGEADVERLGREERPRAVVVAARGHADVVADAVAALAGLASPVPVMGLTGTVLPGWVGPLDLVVAVSLSGEAAPPVAVAAEAGRRGAGVLTVGAADSTMAAVSAQVRGVHVPLPRPGESATSAANTRTAMWSLLTPVLVAADQLGLLPAGPRVLAAVADALDVEAEACRPSSASFVNPAKVLATELAGTVPVALGDGPVSAVAAHRAAGMLARTSRVPALHGTLPDGAGDVVATFGGPFAAQPDDLFTDPFEDGSVGPRLRLLLLHEGGSNAARAVLEIAGRSGVGVSEVVAEQSEPLCRLAVLAARTDFASTYLALGLGLDPATSPHVADLRDALR